MWYNFREKLPDVSPARPASRREAAARGREDRTQEIVAGRAKAPRARQFIWQPAPKLELHADLRSPNVLAMHAPRTAARAASAAEALCAAAGSAEAAIRPRRWRLRPRFKRRATWRPRRPAGHAVRKKLRRANL